MTPVESFYQWELALLCVLSLLPPVLYTVRTRAIWTRSRLGVLLVSTAIWTTILFTLALMRLRTPDPDRYELLTRFMLVPVSALILVNVAWILVVWKFTGEKYRRSQPLRQRPQGEER